MASAGLLCRRGKTRVRKGLPRFPPWVFRGVCPRRPQLAAPPTPGSARPCSSAPCSLPCSRPGRYRRSRQQTGFNAGSFVGAAHTAQTHGGGKLRVASRAPPALAEVKGSFAGMVVTCFPKHSRNHAGRKAKRYNPAGREGSWRRSCASKVEGALQTF